MQNNNNEMEVAKAADRFMGLKTALANGLDPNLVKESILILDENEEAVAFLLERGANPNERYPDGVHPLCLALMISHVDIFRLLVDAMSDLTTASVDKWTIVDFALLSGDHQALEILFQRDPRLKPSPWTCAERGDAPEETTVPSRAKELLAICTSSVLIPPPELYDIYAHVLLSQTEIYRVESNTIDPKLLIKDVFHALFDTAGIIMPTSRVTLCQACLSLQKITCLPGKSKPWFCIHQSRGELDECAKSCPFCRLVADAFDNECVRKDNLIMRHNEKRCGGWIGNCQSCREETSEEEDDHISEPNGVAVTGIRLQLRHDVHYPLDPDEHTFLIAEDRQNMLSTKIPIDGIDEMYLLNMNNPIGVDTSTGSQQTFDVAARWLDKCRDSSNHEDCRKALPDGGDTLGPELPTRILDLTTFPHPRLVETGGTRSPYCALSYCWGDMGTNITTTKGNASQHMEGIPTESIPVFIQEAIIAARTLGYRYIWIDALCIIQDDPDDWDREASKMKDVYANADLTLSSLVARGCHEHLFHPRGSMTTRPIPFNIWTPKDKRPSWEQNVIHQYAVYPSLLINNDGDPAGFSGGDNVAARAPITSRGWVLQEQMLSTRMLYFGSNYILWECLCLATTDLDPSKIISPRTSGGLGTKARGKYAVQGVTYPADYYDSDDLRYQPWGIWQSLLTSYTRRRLTKSSDRIPAFLAVSKALESSIGDEFIGGVWKGQKLLESLSWNVAKADDKQPKAPSWSWISVNQTIEFDCLRRGYGLAESTPLVTLVSFDVQTNHSQSHVSGSITLKGTLHQKEVDLSSKDSEVFFDYQAGAVDRCYALDLVGFNRIISDEYMEESDEEEMGWDEESLPTAIVRLLLEPVDQIDGFDLSCSFRRIGICKDQGDRNQGLEDAILPRTDTSTTGVWNGIKWSKANQVITIV
ncbi:heterokaryon incompatibility protein-domain-containing protein [Fusarium avenaceum]|nr:heterokaryon incompatibility protein-domain-containing protein [Fusarium avenaceum]